MFGDRLKLARKKAGFSLRSLSDALEKKVSAQAIGKYERGDMMPSSGILMKLAKVLNVTQEFLMSEQVEELEGMEFRKVSGTTAGERARVEAAVAAAEQGAKVFLAAPRPYLGDDMTATLRLWLEEGEEPTTPLARAIFSDPVELRVGPDPNGLPFTYTADRQSGAIHRDTDPPGSHRPLGGRSGCDPLDRIAI